MQKLKIWIRTTDSEQRQNLNDGVNNRGQAGYDGDYYFELFSNQVTEFYLF